MAAVRLVIRSLLRRRIAATVALVLLIGVAGGAVLTAAEGARRTATAFPRLLDHVDASDVEVESFGSVRASNLRRLPHVERASDAIGFGMAPDGPGGIPDFDNGAGALASSDGRALLRSDQLLVLEGRLPHPDRPEEVLVNEAAAEQYGMELGDQKRLYLYRFEELGALVESFSFTQAPTPEDLEALRQILTPVDVRVVGVGRAPPDVIANENQRRPGLLLTPAFARAHADYETYRISYVDLRDPIADLPGFRRALGADQPDSGIQLSTRDSFTRTAGNAVGPYHEALLLFAVVAGLTSFLVVGQALARQVVADAQDHRVFSGLGMTRMQLTLAASGRAAATALVGTALAVLVAVAASPLFPIGPARLAEPTPGTRLDLAVLAAGGMLIVVLLIGRALFTGWRRAAAGGADAIPRAAGASRASILSPTAIGVPMALRPTDPIAAAARTSTLIGLVVAMATILAALAFGASLDHLVTTPTAYGWNWDSLLATYDGVTPRVVRTLEADQKIESYTVGARAALDLGDETVAGFGFDPRRGDLLPTVTAGHFPRAADEIALGAAALRRLHRSIGETVAATTSDGHTVQVRIVGRVVVPSLNLDDVYGLADGGALTLDGLHRLAPSSRLSIALVDFADDAGPDPVDAANQRYGEVAGSFTGLQRPGDITSYAGVRRTPMVLAGLFVLLGLGVLAHGLLTTVRGERRSLAVLKTLGFSRRQVRGVVAWQATALVLVAALVAMPVGVAAGRWTWSILAARLGVPADAVIPALGIATVLAASLVVANLIGAGPAGMAARTRPAAVLRAE